MLKRIKETLTCYDSGGKHTKLRSRIKHKLTSHHLLHSDKSTCFYKGKVKGFFKSRLSTIPLVLSASALLLVLGVMMVPFFPSAGADEAYAVDNTNTEESISTQASGMSVQLSLADPDTSSLTTNAETGKVNYISKGFKVTTANVDGYNVYVQTAPGSTNKLTNGNLTIDFVKTDTPTTSFTDNTWGYSVDSTGAQPQNLKYNPVPDATATNLNPAYSSTSTGETKDFTLNFAAKFADNATPGHYGTDVLLSVAAGPHEVASQQTFIGINNPDTGEKYVYMQDVNRSICNKLPSGAEFQLRDKRDNKIYWIGKLTDGLCWMTQNLDLDLTPDGLTAELSDINQDWNQTSENTTVPTLTLTKSNVTTWGRPNVDSVLSYNPGPSLAVVGTKNMPEKALTEEWLSLEDVGGDSSWTPTYDESFINLTVYNSIDGKMVCSKKTGSMLGDMTSTYLPCRVYYYGYLLVKNHYNLHESQGNYYSFNAVTAGDGKNYSTRDEPVPSSICPKGWKLPTSGNSNSPGSFAALGLTTSTYDKSPYYFIYSAYLTTDGYLANSGTYTSYYWSATVNSAYNVYVLQYKLGSYPTLSVSYSSGSRTDGCTVRCVAR